MNSLNEKMIQNNKLYLERKELYKTFGYDIDEERDYIIKLGSPIFGNVLEIATGKGHFTLALCLKGYKLTSCDISEEEQEIAKLNIKYYNLDNLVEFRIEDAEKLSMPDNSYDIIFSINTYHHLIQAVKVFDEMRRVLKPNGKIIISDFNGNGFALISKLHELEGKVHEAHSTDFSFIEKYFKDFNFQIKKYSTTFQDIIIAYNQNL